MNKGNKNILRSLLLLSYLIIIALIIYAFGAIYSFLNTGADRSTMLHTEVKQIDQYLPELEWAPLTNLGRPMDKQTLSEIENDYLDAWYVKLVAFKTNTTKGIDDYYTKSARKNIHKIVEHNSANKTNIDGTTLVHHPRLEFFSEDGQLVVLTDHNIIEYKRIFKDGHLILETNEKSSYRVTLLLEDGFWRIRHLVKLESDRHAKKNSDTFLKTERVKGINYYPQANPWDMFGDSFDRNTIASDFKIISSNGLNSIRIFVPYASFGKANVNTDKLEQLISLLDLAESANLKVMVTLFDFYGDYSVLDWTLTQRHAKTIVNTIKNHKALAYWDIKNEPNLDFKSRGETLVIAWLDNMIDFIKTQDSNHPVTIGWSNAESSLILKEKLDFVSFHYYEDIDDLIKTYNHLKTEIPNKPVVISEYGMSSYRGLWNPFGHSEKKQAEYHKSIQSLFNKNNIPFMSWTLYDFSEIPKEVVGRLPWRQNTQKYFGFIDQNGNKKPAFKYLSKK